MHYLSHASMTKIYMKAHSLNNKLVKDMLVGKIFQDCSSDVPLYLFYCFYKSIGILNGILICRDAFQCRVQLSLWRVRRSWIKSLLKKCCNFDVQREMFKHLGRILYCTRNGSTAMDAIEEFMQIFVDQSGFMSCFRDQWLPRIGICQFLISCS